MVVIILIWTYTLHFQTRHSKAAVSATFSRCENSMYKWRKRNLPSPPESLSSYAATLNSDEWKHMKEYEEGTIHVSSVRGQDLSTSVVYIDPDFASQVWINGIMFVDATFKVVPALIGGYQFLTLMVLRYNHVIPFAWVLMERKTTESYVTVFQEIRRLIPGFSITETMTDFEKALQGALRQVFPGVILHGCLFHYDQAIVNKANSLGLQEFLAENLEGRHIVSLIMSLPLLPANEIPTSYYEIRDSATPTTREVILPFFDYYESEWLRIVTPEVFSVFMLPKRTNNDIELYHKTLIQRFGVHSNIWNFTKTLVIFQRGLRIDLRSLQQGYQISRLPKVSNVLKDDLLFEAWSKLNQPGGLTSRQFLEEAINIFVNPIDAYIGTHNLAN